MVEILNYVHAFICTTIWNNNIRRKVKSDEVKITIIKEESRRYIYRALNILTQNDGEEFAIFFESINIFFLFAL